MPRVLLASDDVTGKWPIDVATLHETAADTSNLNQIKLTGREILRIRNSNTGSTAHTVTVMSVENPADNRSRDITAFSLAAGARAMIGPLAPEGWKQTDGMLYFQANHAEIMFSVIRIPG